jgi:hypothetical protein
VANVRAVLRTVESVRVPTLVINASKASTGKKKTKFVTTNVNVEKSTSTESALLALIPIAPTVPLKELAMNVKITM